MREKTAFLPVSRPSKSVVPHGTVGSNPTASAKKSTCFDKSIFYPSRQAWYVINTHRVLYVIATQWRMASREACMTLFPVGLTTYNADALITYCLTADYIPQQVADYIHGFAVILVRQSES